MAISKVCLALGDVGTQESGESTWSGGGDVESENLRVCCQVSDRCLIGPPPKVVCLWVLIEWRRPGVSLMEWELLGWLRLMAIMGALKTISVINAM